MLVNDAQFHFKTAPPDKAKFKAARDKAADEVLSAWNSFADKAKADPALQGNNLVLAMTGMPAALALRATALKGQDGRPAFDVNNCNDVKTKLSSTDAAARTGAASTPVGKLLDQLDEGVRNAACADQSAWDAKLVRFESSLTDTYGAGKTPAIEKANMLQKIEFESIATSLVACVVENDPNVGGDRDCGPDEVTQTRTLADWMKPRRTYDQNEVTRIAFVR